jgi:Wax ester synthase/diacylglycerol acyltransferase catalytic domain
VSGTGAVLTLSPRDYDAVLFDLDGVLTRTASVHAAAWKKLFDAFLGRRAADIGEPFVPFDIDSDYRRYVDGKPRHDGVAAFLAARSIDLPLGTAEDGPGLQTQHALGNLKDQYFVEHASVRARECGTVIRGTGPPTCTWRRSRSSRWARCAPRRAASTRRARCGESQLGKLPRHRQKLAFAPLSGWPVWVDDDSHFDLDYHLRHTALPAPGSEEDPAGLPRASGRKFAEHSGRAPVTHERGKPSAALCALVVLLLAAPGGAHAIDPKTALDALGFPGDTRTRVEAGQFVEVGLPTRSDRDLNVGIAFLVAKQSPAGLARTVREEKRVLHADPNLIAYDDFAGEGTAAQLEELRLTPAQLKAFAHAAPGEEANLSVDEIAALRAAGGDAHAIEDAVRALLLARYRAYRAKGLAGIAPYARAGSATSASDDLAAVNRGARATRVFSTKLYDLLDHYPDDLPPDFAENLYWMQLRAHGKDTIALEHVFQATFDEAPVLVQRQYYVSTGYNAEQAIVAFLPVDEGTLVIYTNHTSTDQVAGPGGGAKRTIGRTVMAGQLKKLFEATRAGLGR